MPRRDGFNDDEFIHQVDQHYMRLAIGAAVSQVMAAEDALTRERGGRPADGCSRHTCREECIGAAAMRALATMGLEIMPTDVLDQADTVMQQAIQGGTIVVRATAPSMFDAMRSAGRN